MKAAISGQRSAISHDHHHGPLFLLALILLFLLCLLGPCTVRVAAQSEQVVVLHLDDTIQPISADYLKRGIDRAAELHAQAVLVELNTPGGLLDSTRTMVGDILASPSPVIFYIAPAGSRAGSAGFFLMEAADVAAMAPGTNAGAAHPVVELGKIDDIMKQKILNDTLAFLRSYVSMRGRNVNAAQDAVENSKSYTDQEAQQLHLIDVVSPDERTLLDTIDGRTVKRFNGTSQTLHTRGAALVAVAGADAVAPGLAKSAAAADCSAADFSAALRAFSSASNCSMRSFIASSSLASASFSAILFGGSAGLALLVLLSGAAASRAGWADGG